MGHRTNRKHSRRSVSDTESDAESSSPSPSPSGSDDEGTSSNKRRRSHRKERSSSRRERGKKREGEKREKRRRDREKERRQSRREERRRVRKRARDSDDGRSSARSDSEAERACAEPESVLRDMLAEFPNVASDLKQLLQMIDGGQAVDVNGISERILIKHLKKLFRSLELKEKDGVFMLPSNSSPVLMVVGPMIDAHVVHNEKNLEQTQEVKNLEPEHEHGKGVKDDITEAGPSVRRRVIGPEMPSAELLAAAAKLTEAQAEMRDAELEEDTELFIGPAPPAVAAEAESANEAERFEEVTRIMGADVDNPYDVVGVNHKMAAENMKKRYWKLSLLVHPDKCSHPQAHQAFIRLNKAFKDLQDPDKRKVLDDKIKQKEEEEAFKIELKAMREAAQWRRLQGISMEGDDELLADMHVKEEMPKRDEWMTTLPPERKAGVTMQSTRFSKGSKEGRGDTSAWTDTPSDRAQKAKMNYLEAYNEATALASNEEEQKTMKADAELVDMYNKTKRSKSLVQKHQEESTSRSKKKSKQQQPQEKEEWVGKHPWKPWDRETDLVAGRQSVKFDSESMGEGLASRFSSGTFQRNFL